MKLYDHEFGNAEGYCPKCHAPLGITGICDICALEELTIHSENEPFKDEIEAIMKDVFTCPICGRPKTHHRLYGYRCENPEHQAMEDELWMKKYYK